MTICIVDTVGYLTLLTNFEWHQVYFQVLFIIDARQDTVTQEAAAL